MKTIANVALIAIGAAIVTIGIEATTWLSQHPTHRALVATTIALAGAATAIFQHGRRRA